jgi:(S)-sulfolactate dehydrogenase
MPNIVITEFMDAAAIDDLRRSFDVLHDAELWNRPHDLLAAVRDAEALIVRNRTKVTAEVLSEGRQLKVVGRLGVGLDNIDLDAAKARGIVVAPAVGANAVSVAEYVIGTALLLLRGAYGSSGELVAGRWPREALGRGREAAGSLLGLVGYGSIGQLVAEKAVALGFRVAAADDYLPPDHPAWLHAIRRRLNDILAEADVLSLHCPLTPETRGLIGAPQLARMKPGAILINTARGGIVDEAALAEALRSGHLGGAAVDVFSDEPIPAAVGHLFAGLSNVVLTPHIAGVTAEANERISTITAANVRRVLAGG